MLGKAGVQFSKKADGTYRRTQGFGQPGRWWVHIANGMTIKRAMARIVRDAGINTLDNVMAVKILTDNGKACGALGWNVRTGEFVLVRAKTVVSAQGRSATRGTDNSTHNPFNVWMYPYNTSAGVVLGYDVGAAVTELDTYQRATMLPKGYGCPGMNGITNSGAKGINALGQRYMGKYHPLMEIGPRYLLIQGTHRELTEGNGPPFALDVAPMLVLFAIVMTFCILGCFLPSMPLLLICVPIFVPIAKVFGWDLIWFGVIITVLDNMASITPPFGISLFVMKEVAGVTLGAMYRSAVPFVIALFVCLLLIVLFPPLATYLPTFMNG